MEISDRSVTILDKLIRDYIENAIPISSSRLQQALDLDVSSATIRSILHGLDESNFIHQPHTSAGRVPTQKAYRFFVDNLMSTGIEKESEELIDLERTISNMRIKDSWEALSFLTEQLSQQLSMAIVSATEEGPAFRSVCSRLFQEPEFQNPSFTMDFSEVFDIGRLELCRYVTVHKDFNNVRVFIGKENPFSRGSEVAAFTARFQAPRGAVCYLAAFSPMRVDYEHVGRVFNHLFNI